MTPGEQGLVTSEEKLELEAAIRNTPSCSSTAG
jgi:hypothetical protein